MIKNLDILLKLEQIKKHRSQGSQLVSYFAPKGTLVTTIVNFLKSEVPKTSKIKTKMIKKNVSTALQRAIKWVSSHYNPSTENGLALFSGTVYVNGSEEDILEHFYFENNILLYKCFIGFFCTFSQKLITREILSSQLAFHN